MPYYKITAENQEGARVERIIEARSQSDAITTLQEQGLLVLKANRRRELYLRKRVKPQEIITFTRLLSVIVSSGLAINQGLRVVISQQPDGHFRGILIQVLDDIESGETLSDALAKHPDVFNRLYIGMISAGEASGQLGATLQQLFNYLNRMMTLRKRLVSALSYPAVVIGAALFIVAFFMFGLIPNWQKNFQKSFDELPQLTQIVFDLSHFMRDNVFIIIALLLVGGSGIVWYTRTGEGSRRLIGYLLRMPVFGKIYKLGILLRFSRSLETLIKSRVMIVEALRISEFGIDNDLYSDLLKVAREKVERGEFLSKALSDEPNYFPSMMLQMLSMGEESGKLADMTGHVADFYDSELEFAFGRLQSILPPVILIVLAGFVAVIVIAMVLPMFSGL